MIADQNKHRAIVEVENVSKTFHIYDRPSDRIREVFKMFSQHRHYTEFAALKDVSFTVQPGEFLGVVGKNGAGKSTLLKILAGELTPTSGSVRLGGTVSLLQLGLGFNPELSGLENARFASKLMQVPDKELNEVLERIKAFADIGDFFERPVKTYSSGMYSRVSFATAININPDILIADEVLAVGDMRFTQKCLRKMREFKERGKTVVLVTHDVDSVNAFCDRAMWIKDGEVYMQGNAKSVTEHYKNFMLYDRLPLQSEATVASDARVEPVSSVVLSERKWIAVDRSTHEVIGHGGMSINAISFEVEGRQSTVICGGERCNIYFKFICDEITKEFMLGFVVTDKLGQNILHMNSDIAGLDETDFPSGIEQVVRFSFLWPSLNQGTYLLTVGAQERNGDSRMLARAHDVVQIEVERMAEQGDQHGLVLIESPCAEVVSS